MQEEKKKKLYKKIIISLLIFSISYVLILLLWLQVKEIYGKNITYVASHITALVKDVEFNEMVEQDEKITAIFFISHKKRIMRARIHFNTSAYTFNVPLTFAIMGGLFLFINRRKRAYAEAVLILVFIHLFCVFSIGTGMLSSALLKTGVEKATVLNSWLWKLLWQFSEHMVLKFEPFLIGIYMYLKFSSPLLKFKK